MRPIRLAVIFSLSVLLMPLTSHAQPASVPRVGFLVGGTHADPQSAGALTIPQSLLLRADQVIE